MAYETDRPTGPVPQGAPPDGDPPASGSPPSGASPSGHPSDSATPRPSISEEEGGTASNGGPTPFEAVPDEDAALVDADIQAALSQRDEYLDSLRRLQADFENYKKRMSRQQGELTARAGEELVLKLLPVLDAIDLAQQHGEGDAIAPVASSLWDVLSKEGLERVGGVGDVFDPNEHEAVAHEDGDGDDGPVVAGLMRAGYRWRGRLLRPAMVSVKG